MVKCRVLLLDGTEFSADLNRSAKGRELFDKVCEHLTLSANEKDYFSCSYKDEKKIRYWLNNDKKISRQVSGSNWVFAFEVKFYPSDPSILKEEQSRYQLFLQLRQDVMTAKLPCSFMTLALLGSYAVQSLFGDYDLREHGAGFQYFAHVKFAPEQTEELLEKIAELHKANRGLTPAESELNYLQNAKNLALYGVDLHLAKDSTGYEVEIGVCAAGLLLYKDHLRINRFMWPKIIKFSYKWNLFSIKIRPGENEKSPTNLEFKLTNDKMAKRLWKIAVEHHTFYRLREPDNPSNDLLSHFAPKYHYSGRTQYQVQLASSMSVSGTLDRSTTNSLASHRRYGGGSKSLETVMAGYSTERSELYTPESKRTATLDLKNRRTNAGSASPSAFDNSRLYNTFDNSRHGSSVYSSTLQPGDPGYSGATMPPAEVSRLLSASSPRPTASPSSTLSGPYNTSTRPGMYGGGQDVNGQYAGESPYGTGSRYGSATPQHWTGTAERAGSNTPQSAGASERLPPFQDDRLTERGGYRPGGVPGQAAWNNQGSTGWQTASRTYTANDGNMVTEYQAERNVVMGASVGYHNGYYGNGSDDVDYDKALTDAILAVTAMNTDLSVEKIEIVHNRTLVQ